MSYCIRFRWTDICYLPLFKFSIVKMSVCCIVYGFVQVLNETSEYCLILHGIFSNDIPHLATSLRREQQQRQKKKCKTIKKISVE